MSRPSVLPLKLRSLAARSSCASRVSWFPFSGSSPIERSRTSGFGTSRISSAKTDPIAANWRRCSGRASAFAPQSSSTDGPRRPGIGTAIAGRITPGMRRSSRSPAASIAPVFPAETTASAFPSATARTDATSELSGFARTASAGFSSISITPEVAWSSRPCGSIDASPKRMGSMPSVRASSAPATISSGPRSLPIASTAMRTICVLGSVDAERFDFAAVVHAAGQAEVMRTLRLPAVGADVHDRRADRVRRATLVAA